LLFRKKKSLLLRQEHGLKMLKNGELKERFEPKKEDVTADLEKKCITKRFVIYSRQQILLFG
jgi:hypothetical protein